MTEKTNNDMTTEEKLQSIWRTLHPKSKYSFDELDKARESFAELFPEVVSKTILPFENKKNFGQRTCIIKFTRQLKPQPPPDSQPYWCLVNTLIFHKGNQKVWEQEIPEADSFFTDDRSYTWLNIPRYKLGGYSVYFDPEWGWILEFTLSHAEAGKIWELLLKDYPDGSVEYKKDFGLVFDAALKPSSVNYPETNESCKHAQNAEGT